MFLSFWSTTLERDIEALLRRAGATRSVVPPDKVLAFADIVIDTATRLVTRGRVEISLTTKEYELLEYLMRHAGQVVTRTMLLESVWEYHFDPQTNVIDVHISRLRQKIDKGFAKPLLHTIRGAGYCLRAPD